MSRGAVHLLIEFDGTRLQHSVDISDVPVIGVPDLSMVAPQLISYALDQVVEEARRDLRRSEVY